MTRVVKVGGRAQSDPTLPDAVAALHAREARLCIVHGGGDAVTALQRSLGQEPQFINGRRATPPAELEVVRMVLSGTINKQLVGALLAAGVPAAGVSGEDGGLLSCRLFAEGALGSVGEPHEVNPRLLNVLMDADFVPVVSPLGRLQSSGEGCNVNGDDAAAALAVALGATELLMIADVEGVRGSDGRTMPFLEEESVRELIASGAATGGMIAKLEAAMRALHAGVPCVRIGSVRAIASPSAGTAITAGTPHAAVAR